MTSSSIVDYGDILFVAFYMLRVVGDDLDNILIHAVGTMPSNSDIFQIFKCLHIHQVLALIGFKAFKVPYPCLMGVPVGNHRCSVPIIETAR